MKHALIATAIAAAFSVNAHAHGCSAPGACQTVQPSANATAHAGNATSTNTTSSQGGIATQDQWQQQRQSAEQANRQELSGSGNSSATINPTVDANISDNRNYSSRYVDLHIQPAQPIAITPAASTSRYVGVCGPRMVVRSRAVEGVFYGAFTDSTFVVGEDHQVLAAPEAYRIVEVIPGIRQAIGHRLIESSAVVTVSGSRTVGLGGFSDSRGGAGTAGGASGMQRLVTTVRLEECVAYELRDKPHAPPKKTVKRRPARKAAPACNACQATKTTTTTTTTTTTEAVAQQK